MPDISAIGDWITGMSEGFTEPGANGGPDTYATTTNAGTSLAAPMVAGMVAAAQQGRRHHPVGNGSQVGHVLTTPRVPHL